MLTIDWMSKCSGCDLASLMYAQVSNETQ
jgi:hypothetical protein